MSNQPQFIKKINPNKCYCEESPSFNFINVLWFNLITSVLRSERMWLTKFLIFFHSFLLDLSEQFINHLETGSSQLSPYSLTLVSGLLAVVSVNIVIAFYIYMAMKEPSDKHEPDPSFLANAKASVNQSAVGPDTSSQSSKKQE